MDLFNPAVIESFKGSILSNLLTSYPSLMIFALFIYRIMTALQEFDKNDWQYIWLMLTHRHPCTAHISIFGSAARRSNSWSSSSTSVIPHSLKAVTRYALKKSPYGLRNLTESFTAYCETLYNDNSEKHSNNKLSKENAILNYIPTSNTIFPLTNDIWIRTGIHTVRTDGENPMIIDHFSLELTSYTLTPEQLCDFVNKITDEYLQDIANSRKGKRYVYRLRSFDEGRPMWNETLFDSNRTFDNLHCEGKEEFKSQLQAFIDGEEWYKSHGHTYACGIALHGPPGTGKTSMIKAIANFTNRHIIEIPLSKLTTEDELFDAYFCEIYNRSTGEVISFRDKIICFEDIDCQQHLLSRDKVHSDSDIFDISNISPRSHIQIPTNPSYIKKTAEALMSVSLKPKPCITLDTMLNLLDGVRENTGRMLIFTTNHFDKLDPAFTRPGRVDIEKHMNKIGIETIKSIYTAHTSEKLQDNELSRLLNARFSPCEVIKAVKTSTSASSFISYLEKLIV